MSVRTYSVGKIAELCNISAKQLRYFDKQGIITPAVRDDKNHYRYYTDDQIADILLVKEMRQLGIPLSKISHLLSHKSVNTLQYELNKWLNDAREEIDRAMAKYDKTLELFFRLTNARHFLEPDSRNILTNSFSVIDVDARTLVSTRNIGNYSAEVLFIDRRAELYGIIETYDLETVGANMAIFHSGHLNQFSPDIYDCRADLEVCMVVKSTRANCSYCRPQKAFKAVTAIHVGHYRYMKPVYELLEQWAQDRGLALSGAAIEEYIIGATHTKIENNYVTRLLMPLKGYDI